MFKLTKEQQDCVAAAKLGEDLKTKAFAGSGKTSTLVEIAKALPDKRILYLCFNKSIQEEAAEKFPDNVDCRTAHSLAFKRFVYVIKNRTSNSSPKLNIPNIIKYESIDIKYDYSQQEIARKVLKLLKRFFCSNYFDSFLKPKPKDVEEELKKDKKIEEQRAIEVDQYVHEIAYDYWINCMKKDSDLPINHDVYLKKFQLSKPDLSSLYDVILFDECQDANPVLLDILLNQTCQIIYVGDAHQQIYAWRGAINAFDNIEGVEHYLSQSFRFGNSLAELANKILAIKGETQQLKGFDELETKIVQKMELPYTSLCRTNGKAIEVILENLDKDIHLVGNNLKYTFSLLNDACSLYEGKHEDIKDPLIRSYKSWDSLVAEYKEDEEKDPNFTLMVNFVEKYERNLRPTLIKFQNASYVKEKDADIIVSTVHKAKGREWDNVVIENDFKLSEELLNEKEIVEKDKIDFEELNLLYVAITRAQKQIRLRGHLIINICKILEIKRGRE